ncbi:Uncharacterized protein PHSC3_001008 [Chlamydiales bacterium STE3]|nr:Uncharacterized protein PHSC3_001008 [Chlamydiales bacterium STE3]
MDHHATDFYQSTSEGSPRGCFHRVIALNNTHEHKWEDVGQLASTLPKGWFELASLNTDDKISFVKEFWISKLTPYSQFTKSLLAFFERLDDIGIYLVQKKFDDPFECHMIYSLRNNGGFFKGLPPVKESDLMNLKQNFSEVILPKDFLQFLLIHDGFCKATDTGMIPCNQLYGNYIALQKLLAREDSVFTNSGDMVNPKLLIPFYESFGMPFFQCFWGEWYPENEMGNVYFSGKTKTISNVKCRDPSSENMAFPTFRSWLNFYLETIE